MARADILRKHAEFKAALVAYVNSLTEPTSSRTIMALMRPKLKELGIKETNGAKMLRDLSDAGLVNVDKSTRFFTFWGNGSKPPFPISDLPVDSDPQVVSAQTVARQVTSKKPAIALDVVKGTGRVRLTINDLTIEIGVVEK